MTTDFRALCAELTDELHDYASANPHHDSDELVARARAALAAEPLPSNYIDSEHTGQDRELLEIFYAACQAEGGTADEIQLRGIRAVLAATEPVAPVPVSERPWEREGWCDAKGWCWWFDEEGTGWVFSAPGPWNLAQWYLPHHAIPQPASLADEEPKITEDPLSRQTPEPQPEPPVNGEVEAVLEATPAEPFSVLGLSGLITAQIGCARVGSGTPTTFRWGRRNGTLVLQVGYAWRQGAEHGVDWKDVPTVDLDNEAQP